MQSIRSILATSALTVLFASNVMAQANTPRFDQRQANQDKRIDAGVASGRLTENEAARLDKGQDRLESMEDKAKADGVVTKHERARLQQAENVQSRHIARQKHDRQNDRNHDGKNDRHARRTGGE